jgi:hypothetical protein
MESNFCTLFSLSFLLSLFLIRRQLNCTSILRYVVVVVGRTLIVNLKDLFLYLISLSLLFTAAAAAVACAKLGPIVHWVIFLTTLFIAQCARDRGRERSPESGSRNVIIFERSIIRAEVSPNDGE